MAKRSLVERLKTLVENPILFWALVLVNLAGIAFGLDYYWTQLSVSPWQQWLFIADCPMYAGLFVVSLFFCRYGKLPRLLGFVSVVGLIKYAIWTILVIGLYAKELLFAQPAYYGFMISLHLGMIAESLVLLNFLPKRLNAWPRVPDWTLAWFLLNDVFDYGFGTMPFLPDGRWTTLLTAESVLATMLIIFGGFSLRYRQKS